VSLIAGLLALHIWKADLRTPFVYHDDALYYGMLVKTIVDQGGWLSNTHLGAPGILQLHDFPAADTPHLFTIKVMAWFTPNWAVLLNLYFLMGFPLIAVSALAVFRHFRIGYWSALAASVLYALLPSRLVKNEARRPRHLLPFGRTPRRRAP
jgi:phosphoglycerol transferase